jgi:hypothetical protein
MPFIKFVPPKKKSGQCFNLSHNPPGYQVLKPGTHIWKCPACGKKQKIIVPERPRMMSWNDWRERERKLHSDGCLQ